MKSRYFKMNETTGDGENAGGGDVVVDTKIVPDAKVDVKTEVKVDAKSDTSEDKTSKATWPDDWREKYSKDDAKKLARLGRYTSPEAAFDALIAAQNRISSGELKGVLPKNATPEEVTQWRKDNGIPDAPEKYDLKFDNGLVIGEADKEIVDGFLKSAHAKNLNTDQVKSTIEWYYSEQERVAAEREAKDEQERTVALDALNAEWGSEFRRNTNAIKGILQTFPENVRGLLEGGRLSDGTAIFNNPEVLRGFAAIARELNPAGTVVGAGAGDATKSVNEEISAIEKTMKTNRSAYNKDEKLQARYRDLLGAREKMAERKAA